MSRLTPPAVARMLFRFAPLGDRRTEVEADLLELFAERTGERGPRYARRRCSATSSACGEIKERSCIEPTRTPHRISCEKPHRM